MGTMADWDVIVLGGGSAGTSAAKSATQVGARTLLINDGELGGLCILRGCMPTKAMLASAHALHETLHLDEFGVRLEGRAVPDFARIMERKNSQVERFQRAKIRSIESQGYEVTIGRARFTADGAIDLDGRRLESASYVIATGSVPKVLPIPGIEGVPVLTSDDVMRLESQPGSLLVQGAGPIGLELAQFFARIGTRVLLVNRSPLLSRTDAECGEELRRVLAEEPNLRLAVPGAVERLQKTNSGLAARVRSDAEIIEFEADALLMAAGRRAALDDLGLEQLGLDPGSGRLEHDASMRTAHPRIFVAGDATGSFQILHLANQEGAVAGHNAAGATPAAEMDYRLKMAVTFTDPPFATVGLTVVEAAKDGLDPVVGRARFPETGRAITMGTRHGLWKILADRRSGELLGSSIVGPRADDLIHLIATVMHYRGNVEEICGLPWYHPTLSEVILNIGRDIAGQLDRSCTIPGAATLPPGYSIAMHREAGEEGD
jgi:pyruvate/2-oxoglutarate dehydrogenase complex dihydrolipoamide dehydrogenase (E3) component